MKNEDLREEQDAFKSSAQLLSLLNHPSLHILVFFINRQNPGIQIL